MEYNLDVAVATHFHEATIKKQLRVDNLFSQLWDPNSKYAIYYEQHKCI
jgi:hypothetical protein